MDVLTIKRGNPLTATCELTYTANEEAINLSGCVILFTAKNLNDISESDDNAVIKSELVISEAANGLAILSLTAPDTAVAAKTYKCDIRVYKDGELKENTDIFYAVVERVVTIRTS